MDPILQLKDLEPITHGRSRLVFEHPDDSDLLVKVIRPEVVDDRFGSKTKWYKKRRRFGKFISYIREIQEFLAVNEARGSDALFLQRVIGFARTDMGLGLVLEAVRWTDGSLAPNLTVLIKENRLDSTAEAALEKFFDDLLDCSVIISDLNPGNIVYTHSEEHGYYFVLIDGIGNNSLLPFKTLSQKMNRKSKLRRYSKLRKRMERSRNKHSKK